MQKFPITLIANKKQTNTLWNPINFGHKPALNIQLSQWDLLVVVNMVSSQLHYVAKEDLQEEKCFFIIILLKILPKETKKQTNNLCT